MESFVQREGHRIFFSIFAASSKVVVALTSFVSNSRVQMDRNAH
jgi:hypothetical protein